MPPTATSPSSSADALIASGDAIVRHGIRAILATSAPDLVIGETTAIRGSSAAVNLGARHVPRVDRHLIRIAGVRPAGPVRGRRQRLCSTQGGWRRF